MSDFDPTKSLHLEAVQLRRHLQRPDRHGDAGRLDHFRRQRLPEPAPRPVRPGPESGEQRDGPGVHADAGAGAGHAGADRPGGRRLARLLAAAVAIERPAGYPIRMTRRRLILAVCVAVFALGAAWWLFSDSLTAEEQRLVGTWRLIVPGLRRSAEDTTAVWTFKRDRTVRGFTSGLPDETPHDFALWRVRENELMMDLELSAVRRRLRPVARFIGFQVAGVVTYRLEHQGADEAIFDARRRPIPGYPRPQGLTDGP